MFTIAEAVGLVLQAAGVVSDVTPFVDKIIGIVQGGKNVSQAELDSMLAEINQRSAEIQNIKTE